MNARIELIQGDITKLDADAIVNAANTSLLGGGGVDGAIHHAAGPRLLDECRTLGGCQTGKAKITSGYNLKAKFVIHTVGPVWRGGDHHEEDLLSSCYRESLELAISHSCKTIAFPNISTGVYHFPKLQAATIAIQEVSKFLQENPSIRKVSFACFDNENLEIYQKLLEQKS
jgi:O-acetyl-ADP-ribose deacetylase